MRFLRLIPIAFVISIMAGCACTDQVCTSSDGSTGTWSDVSILPNITNVPEVKRTPDGFDPPFNYY